MPEVRVRKIEIGVRMRVRNALMANEREKGTRSV